VLSGYLIDLYGGKIFPRIFLHTYKTLCLFLYSEKNFYGGGKKESVLRSWTTS
jgi:hypothetical protein